jgi:hypothetical protein
MAAIGFFDPDATEFMQAADAYPDALKAQLADAEVAHTAVRFHQGLPGKLQLFEIRLDPGLEISTLYGFRVGPDGCRYLNFRAQADSTSFSKDDVVEARG